MKWLRCMICLILIIHLGREFEEFMIKLFEKLGYSTTVTNRSKEYGCDMMLQQSNYRIAVQTTRSESELTFTSVQRVLDSSRKYASQMSSCYY